MQKRHFFVFKCERNICNVLGKVEGGKGVFMEVWAFRGWEIDSLLYLGLFNDSGGIKLLWRFLEIIAPMDLIIS